MIGDVNYGILLPYFPGFIELGHEIYSPWMRPSSEIQSPWSVVLEISQRKTDHSFTDICDMINISDLLKYFMTLNLIIPCKQNLFYKVDSFNLV